MEQVDKHGVRKGLGGMNYIREYMRIKREQEEYEQEEKENEKLREEWRQKQKERMKGNYGIIIDRLYPAKKEKEEMTQEEKEERKKESNRKIEMCHTKNKILVLFHNLSILAKEEEKEDLINELERMIHYSLKK